MVAVQLVDSRLLVVRMLVVELRRLLLLLVDFHLLLLGDSRRLCHHYQCYRL